MVRRKQAFALQNIDKFAEGDAQMPQVSSSFFEPEIERKLAWIDLSCQLHVGSLVKMLGIRQQLLGGPGGLVGGRLTGDYIFQNFYDQIDIRHLDVRVVAGKFDVADIRPAIGPE